MIVYVTLGVNKEGKERHWKKLLEDIWKNKNKRKNKNKKTYKLRNLYTNL